MQLLERIDVDIEELYARLQVLNANSTHSRGTQFKDDLNQNFDLALEDMLLTLTNATHLDQEKLTKIIKLDELQELHKLARGVYYTQGDLTQQEWNAFATTAQRTLQDASTRLERNRQKCDKCSSRECCCCCCDDEECCFSIAQAVEPQFSQVPQQAPMQRN
jgi:ElaB/YqjD/DUF883 family membrane-anchored ribosome-binding protein